MMLRLTINNYIINSKYITQQSRYLPKYLISQYLIDQRETVRSKIKVAHVPLSTARDGIYKSKQYQIHGLHK